VDLRPQRKLIVVHGDTRSPSFDHRLCRSRREPREVDRQWREGQIGVRTAREGYAVVFANAVNHVGLDGVVNRKRLFRVEAALGDPALDGGDLERVVGFPVPRVSI